MEAIVYRISCLCLIPQAHSSVEKASIIGGVVIRMVPTDEHFSVRAETLEKMVAEDKATGFIPFFVWRRAHRLKHTYME